MGTTWGSMRGRRPGRRCRTCISMSSRGSGAMSMILAGGCGTSSPGAATIFATGRPLWPRVARRTRLRGMCSRCSIGRPISPSSRPSCRSRGSIASTLPVLGALAPGRAGPDRHRRLPRDHAGRARSRCCSTGRRRPPSWRRATRRLRAWLEARVVEVLLAAGRPSIRSHGASGPGFGVAFVGSSNLSRSGAGHRHRVESAGRARDGPGRVRADLRGVRAALGRARPLTADVGRGVREAGATKRRSRSTARRRGGRADRAAAASA